MVQWRIKFHCQVKVVNNFKLSINYVSWVLWNSQALVLGFASGHNTYSRYRANLWGQKDFFTREKFNTKIAAVSCFGSSKWPPCRHVKTFYTIRHDERVMSTYHSSSWVINKLLTLTLVLLSNCAINLLHLVLSKETTEICSQPQNDWK